MTQRKERRSSKLRILIWIMVMFFTGIGLGSLLTTQSCKSKRSKTAFKGEEQNLSNSTIDKGGDSNRNQRESEADLVFETEPLPIVKSNLPTIALIIDDLGYTSLDLVARLCDQRVTFDVAILPYQEFTKQSADIAHSKGKEVMLHLPMEPNGYPGVGKNPGPYAVMYDLSEHEVRHRVRKAMAAIPFIKGVNNHMGSRITRDHSRMIWILEEIKAKRYFFVDSRTEKDSVAFSMAVDLAVPSAMREVFLDDDRNPAAIAKQWKLAMDIARTKGSVTAIGHICPETISMLEKLIPEASGKVRFVAVSHIVK